MKKVAHFLLIPELLHSPPNNAIIEAYIANGYHVDIYAPGNLPAITRYGTHVRTFRVDYSWLWIIKNILQAKWFSYSIVSGTSEDPICLVALISLIYRRKSICLVDEIKSGSYRGDRSDLWKDICQEGIRRSNLSIVNDESRVQLLRDYAKVDSTREIFIYPGCFYRRPEISEEKRRELRLQWGFKEDDFIIGSSGGFNMTAGADWLIDSILDSRELRSVIQPLGVSPLSLFLLESLDCKERVYIQHERMDWFEAWESAQGLDIGICIYHNQAPQFQNMGISSNRLCMFIAMGVPVIAGRQKSFEFLEEYGCGRLVSTYEEFKEAIDYIKVEWKRMHINCEKCFQDYIRPYDRFLSLSRRIGGLG